MITAQKSLQYQETSKDEIDEKIKRLDMYFQTHVTYDYRFRIKQLKNLKKALSAHEDKIFEVVKEELGKSRFEAFIAEIGTVKAEISYVIRRLRRWVKSHRLNAGLMNIGSRARVVKVPKGKVLIIGTWNYPVNLILMPLISSISAGNVSMIKPSENAPKTAQVVESIIEMAFEPGFVEVAQGGPEIGQYLLEKSWGHVLYTGSTRVGKLVYEQAAKTMTPVTLELGGKSPTIVDNTVNLKYAARRIVLGKYFNNGQTCVAPDYLVVKKEIKEEFTHILSETIIQFYTKDPKSNDNYGHIINDRQFARLRELVKDQNTINPTGSELDPEARFIPPLLIDGADFVSPIMQEEIFGPILVVLEYENREDLLKILNENPTPLVLYVFSRDKDFIQFLDRTYPSGDISVNEVIAHAGVAGLPIGGVDSSGLGTYRGIYGFRTFSNDKTVLKRTMRFDDTLRYPPYPRFLDRLLKIIFR